MTVTSDLLIIGAGPAGFAAAINAASEGLSVILTDRGPYVGGQASQSAAIENYPGFPEGLTGAALAMRLTEQAVKFGVTLALPYQMIRCEPDATGATFLADDGTEFRGKATILATGVQYRRLGSAGLDRFMGRGVQYGMPTTLAGLTHKRIGIVGGANSAGQAACKFASLPGTEVTLYIRHGIVDQMSTYLIDRLRNLPNVTILEGVEVHAVAGGPNGQLGEVACSDGSVRPCHRLFVFIGAAPYTAWLRGACNLDPRGFVYTPEGYETSLPGVFAAGDVRAGSVKRIATAVGEGICAVQAVHHYLERT